MLGKCRVIRDVQAANKAAMESTSKLSDKYYAKLSKLKEKVRKQLLIMLYFSLHTIVFTLR